MTWEYSRGFIFRGFRENYKYACYTYHRNRKFANFILCKCKKSTNHKFAKIKTRENYQIYNIYGEFAFCRIHASAEYTRVASAVCVCRIHKADKNIAWRYMHLTTGDKTWHILCFCYYTYLNVLSGLFVNQSRDISTLTARGSTLVANIAIFS